MPGVPMAGLPDDAPATLDMARVWEFSQSQQEWIAAEGPMPYELLVAEWVDVDTLEYLADLFGKYCLVLTEEDGEDRQTAVWRSGRWAFISAFIVGAAFQADGGHRPDRKATK